MTGSLYVAVNLSSEQSQNILGIYEENFEKAYLEHTEQFYEVKAPEFLAEHGVKEYMLYAQSKLMEEEIRAKRYLETRAGCESVTKLIECCVKVLVVKFKDTILAECPDMIKTNSTQRKVQVIISLPFYVFIMVINLDNTMLSRVLVLLL